MTLTKISNICLLTTILLGTTTTFVHAETQKPVAESNQPSPSSISQMTNSSIDEASNLIKGTYSTKNMPCTSGSSSQETASTTSKETEESSQETNTNENKKALKAGFTKQQIKQIKNIPSLTPVTPNQITNFLQSLTGDQAKIVNEAKKYLGVPYVWGGTTPSGFDCSGFVQYVFKHALNINLPRVTTQQETCGTEVSLNALQPGDLVFYGSRGATYHVAIYIGDGLIIHSPQPGQKICIVQMKYFMPQFARRIIKDSSSSSIKKLPPKNVKQPTASKGINYESHISKVGWMNNVTDGSLSGSVGYNLPMEAIKISLGNKNLQGSVEYRVHVQNLGWQPWIKNGEIAGITGKSLQLEAIQIRLTGEAANCYDIEYQAHIANKGWLAWCKNGEVAGTTGQKLGMQAIKIKIVRKKITQGSAILPKEGLAYRTHLSYEGWLGYVQDNQLSGTTGLNIPVEFLDLYLNGSKKDIEMDAHVANKGWLKNCGGTTGECHTLQAIKIRLKNGLEKKYDIVYRTHVQNLGWQPWVKNNEIAGTTGKSLAIQAIQIKLIKKE